MYAKEEFSRLNTFFIFHTVVHFKVCLKEPKIELRTAYELAYKKHLWHGVIKCMTWAKKEREREQNSERERERERERELVWEVMLLFFSL